MFSFYFIFFFLARDRNDLDMFIGFLTVGMQDGYCNKIRENQVITT